MLLEELLCEEHTVTAPRPAPVALARPEGGQPPFDRPRFAHVERLAQDLHRRTRAHLRIGERLLRIRQVAPVELIEAVPAPVLRFRAWIEAALVPSDRHEERCRAFFTAIVDGEERLALGHTR